MTNRGTYEKPITLVVAAAMTAICTKTLLAAVTQQSVIGTSSHPVYLVRIRGTDGLVYVCKPETTTGSSGDTARICVREDSIQSLLASGTGIGAGGAAASGLLVAILVSNSGSNGTTATTRAPGS